jgi:hypothetical protein
MDSCVKLSRITWTKAVEHHGAKAENWNLKSELVSEESGRLRSPVISAFQHLNSQHPTKALP